MSMERTIRAVADAAVLRFAEESPYVVVSVDGMDAATLVGAYGDRHVANRVAARGCRVDARAYVALRTVDGVIAVCSGNTIIGWSHEKAAAA